MALRCGTRHQWQTGNRPLGQQSRGEFTPAIPTTRAGDAPLPADANIAEIRRHPRLSSKPFQPGAQPLLSHPLQDQPCRCSCRVASIGRGIKGNPPALVETGSHPSASTDFVAGQAPWWLTGDTLVSHYIDTARTWFRTIAIEPTPKPTKLTKLDQKLSQ